MKARLERLKRIDQLQRRLHALSEWRLLALGQQQDRLTDARKEMLNALSSDLFTSGGAAAAATRRIRRLELELESVKGLYQAQAKRSLEHGARSLLVDGALKAAGAENRRNDQNKALAELIESTLHARGSASRKA